MESLEYVKAFTRVVLGLMAVGITAQCIYICILGTAAEEEPKEIIKKVSKKIFALLIAICLTEFTTILAGYW